MKVDPNEPKEPDYDYSGSGEGVVGGVVGGVAPVAPPPPPAKVVAAVEDAPVYPTAGYKKAQAADPGCVQTGVVTRMNDTDMERLHGGVVTIQFAVGRDGQTAQFKVLTSGVSDRAKGAIWAAIQSCKWVPGADPSGKPVALLVTLPLRFKQE
jgi:protein TonB